MGVCNCRHTAENHKVIFQKIYAIKRGRCKAEGCECQSYVRNPDYHTVSP